MWRLHAVRRQSRRDWLRRRLRRRLVDAERRDDGDGSAASAAAGAAAGTSVPEPHSAAAEEAAYVVHASAADGAGEALPASEVPRVRRAFRRRQGPQDDRRAGEDLVSEPTNKMEVG